MECAVQAVRAGVGFVATAVLIRAVTSMTRVVDITSGALIASRHLAFHVAATQDTEDASPAFGLGSRELVSTRRVTYL